MNEGKITRLSVLFILPSTAIGGAETRYATLMTQMQRFRPVVLTYRANAQLFEEKGISVYYFEEYGFGQAMPISFQRTKVFTKAIRQILAKEQVVLLFGVMHIGTFYASVAKDLLRLRQPLIGSILGHLSSYFRFSGHQPSFFERRFLQYLIRRPSRMIVSSAGVRDDLLEHFGGVPDRVVVIPNGIDLQRVDRLSREPCPELPSFDGVTVIMVARLCPGKDFSTLIDAVAGAQKTIRVRLVLVGEGDYQNEIERMISRQNLGQQVLLVGYQSNPFKFMKRSDCFVLSSFHEGFGNVLVEAMALGLPVLSSDCPTGPREIIENGENGFLFPVGDKDALMSLILRLQSDAELRAKLSRAALQRAQNFESRAMVTRYEDLIEEALNEK